MTFAQEWLASNVIPQVEKPGSLAVQMNQRAMDEERVRAFSCFPSTSLTPATHTQARKQREAEEASLAQAQAAKLEHEREEQFKEDALRQLLAREQQYARLSPQLDLSPVRDAYQYPYQSGQIAYQRRRARAGSEATAMPADADEDWDWDAGMESDKEHAYDAMTMTETFPVDVEVDGMTFNTVRLFHPRPGSCLFSKQFE